MPKKQKPPLSELESNVMKVVWDDPPVTAEGVRERLAPRINIKDSTVRTILRRLEAKGYVSHETEGRTFLYAPVEGSQLIAAEAVHGIIERFCNGSVESMLMGLVDREVISSEKLQMLADRIAAKKLESSETTGKRTRRKGT